MKSNDKDRCPGCGKHCPMKSVQCGYGRKYFLKMAAKPAETKPRDDKKKHKWEKYVENGGVMWQLLKVSRDVKKSLDSGKYTETELLSSITDQDRQTLSGILSKLSSAGRHTGISAK